MGLPILRDQIGRCWIKTLETPVLPWQPELTLSYFFVQQRHLLDSLQTAFLREVNSWCVECSVFSSLHNGKSVGGETAKIFTVFSHHLELHTPGKCQALCYQRAFLKKTGENWKEQQGFIFIFYFFLLMHKSGEIGLFSFGYGLSCQKWCWGRQVTYQKADEAQAQEQMTVGLQCHGPLVLSGTQTPSCTVTST